ncbi:MAG: hypothetical protein AB1584_20260 [Pseudomonadota bacterium]
MNETARHARHSQSVFELLALDPLDHHLAAQDFHEQASSLLEQWIGILVELDVATLVQLHDHAGFRSGGNVVAVANISAGLRRLIVEEGIRAIDHQPGNRTRKNRR